MEPAKQVPNRRGTMPQQHAWVGLHRLATLRLRWTTNHETHCEWVPVDLLRRWHLITTSNTGCDPKTCFASKTPFGNWSTPSHGRLTEGMTFFSLLYLLFGAIVLKSSNDCFAMYTALSKDHVLHRYNYLRLSDMPRLVSCEHCVSVSVYDPGRSAH